MFSLICNRSLSHSINTLRVLNCESNSTNQYCCSEEITTRERSRENSGRASSARSFVVLSSRRSSYASSSSSSASASASASAANGFNGTIANNGGRSAFAWTKKIKKTNRNAFLKVSNLVSVDVGPAAALGTALMLSSIALYQIRAQRPEVSRDKDVFFSSVGLLCGGILVFQGWRLDPLMLFGQLMTAGTAVAFASETIGLRANLLEVEEKQSRERRQRKRGYADDDDNEWDYEDEDEDDDEYERSRSRRGGGGRRGGPQPRRNNNNRGFALPARTETGSRRFDDSFDEVYYNNMNNENMMMGNESNRYSSSSASRAYDNNNGYDNEPSSSSRGKSEFSREFERSRGGETIDTTRTSPTITQIDNNEEGEESEKRTNESKSKLDPWGSSDDVF